MGMDGASVGTELEKKGKKKKPPYLPTNLPTQFSTLTPSNNPPQTRRRMEKGVQARGTAVQHP